MLSTFFFLVVLGCGSSLHHISLTPVQGWALSTFYIWAHLILRANLLNLWHFHYHLHFTDKRLNNLPRALQLYAKLLPYTVINFKTSKNHVQANKENLPIGAPPLPPPSVHCVTRSPSLTRYHRRTAWCAAHFFSQAAKSDSHSGGAHQI